MRLPCWIVVVLALSAAAPALAAPGAGQGRGRFLGVGAPVVVLGFEPRRMAFLPDQRLVRTTLPSSDDLAIEAQAFVELAWIGTPEGCPKSD